ncbi:MAG: farnesyl diphosphate synthase [Pseudomonadota bacterium]
MRQIQERLEKALDHALPEAAKQPTQLHQAMRYVSLNGGKRVRPLLVFAAGELSQAPDAQLETAACAVELIHVYSLVHDDLPCMDNDVLRRGRATCHVAYDEATALLVGDSLQTLAFELLARPAQEPTTPSLVRLEMLHLLAQASGSTGMAGGQAIDLASVGKTLDQAQLAHMHALKTGALIRAAILLGALSGKALSVEERAALERFAHCVGLLFQLVDDILDCTANTATLGKTAGKDAAADKPTYVSILGLSAARNLVATLREEAHSALACFAERSKRLLALADFISDRSF